MLFFSAVFAPIFQSLFGYPSGEGIYKLLSNICHQYPTRCLWIFGRPCGLCSRCLFGYIGIALSLLILVRLGSRFRFFYLSLGASFLLPGIVDAIIQLTTSYESTNSIRAITGLLGGVGFGVVVWTLGRGGSVKCRHS